MSAAVGMGKLFLVPTPLDFGCDVQAPLQDVLPAASLQTAARLTHWICENAKSTRAYLNRVHTVFALAHPLQAQTMVELPHAVHKKGDHRPSAFDAKPLLAPALHGIDIGLLSEAGMPAIADPGASVVRAAHELGLMVVPLVGPVSLLLALASSGLNGQNFAFVGYLPQDATARTQRIRDLESHALKTGQTQIMIETPYRNAALFTALIQTLRVQTRLSVASALTMPQAFCKTASVDAWRAQPAMTTLALPTVFLLGP